MPWQDPERLWENSLHQAQDSLKYFGRPVLGGGLRFVMPPKPDEPDPVTTEVKIESFLQDTKSFFIEVQLLWPKPSAGPVPLDPGRRVRDLDAYIENSVIPFILDKI